MYSKYKDSNRLNRESTILLVKESGSGYINVRQIWFQTKECCQG